MTLADVSQFITAIAALGAVLMSARNGRKIEEVHLSINGRMDELLKVTSEAQHALGVKQEFDRSKNE